VDVEVRFQPNGKRVRVPPGTLILDAARRAGLPVASACGANGLCARCGVRVLAGRECVSAETPDEMLAKAINRVDPSERLSCMVTVTGDVQVTSSYW
jgi:uncharacterized 2Fe-2S/4Fe-4S cluster protein (DUF4445 family)